MNVENQVGIQVRSINQIGMAVSDVERVVQMYWNILGIGPWTIGKAADRDFYDRIYRGKSAYFVQKYALADIGTVEFELAETQEGQTPQTDFLAEHGEGIQHLQYTVDNSSDVEEHVKILARQGFPLYMRALLPNDGSCSYVDTRSALKTTWEIVKYPEAFSSPTSRYPSNETEESPAWLKVKAIDQVGIVVKNLEDVMQSYSKILGIGPWKVVDYIPPMLRDTTYRNKPSNFTSRSATTTVGRIELELVQPLSGDNLFIDHICDHGEGIHHLGISVSNIDETIRILNREGFSTLMSGRLSNNVFAYLDTKGPLRTIFKVMSNDS
ncbi:VOC family protein [Chloroflexota bacterium]